MSALLWTLGCVPQSVRGRIRNSLPTLVQKAVAQALVSPGLKERETERQRKKKAKQDERQRKKEEREKQNILMRQLNILVRQLEVRLWSGFASIAVDELERIRNLDSSPAKTRAAAAWALAKWNVQRKSYVQALDDVAVIREAVRLENAPLKLKETLLEVECYIQTGDTPRARLLISNALEIWPSHPWLCIAMASTYRSSPQDDEDIGVLDWLNRMYEDAGLLPLAKINQGRPLRIDNLTTSTSPPTYCTAGPKVSVIMPAYNAGNTIKFALESLLAQTWHNIELIVVDDASTDNTPEVVQEIALRDKRVTLLRQAENLGAYSARNRGLAKSSGSFVRVHDADDWSHPEAIYLQVSRIISGEDRVNVSRCVRVTQDMQPIFYPKTAELVRMNTSSILYPREELCALGGWDEVRFGADTELAERYERRYGIAISKSCELLPPLSFVLSTDCNLTSDKDTGTSSLVYGARREYTEAFRYWHDVSGVTGLYKWPLPLTERPFPVPSICKRFQKQEHFDIVLQSDFALPGGTRSCNENMLLAAQRAQLRIGCVHSPRVENAGKDIDVRLRRLIHNGVAQSLVPGEEFSCDLLIFHHPPILENIPDRLPRAHARNCVLVYNQLPVTRAKGGRVVYDPETVAMRATRISGVEPLIAPISPLVRGMLSEQAGRATLHDWIPLLIDHADWRRTTADVDMTRRPIVGRHSRDQIDKWPSDPASLRSAYCADSDLEVRILGGAKCAETTIGELPGNWRVLAFDGQDPKEFLQSLDFYVHFPHEEMFEAFGRGPMEAMATGVVAILPPQFEVTFGDAAVYAEPSQVLEVIEHIWNDKHRYQSQVERGFSYVERHCSYLSFLERLGEFHRFASPVHARETTSRSRKSLVADGCGMQTARKLVAGRA
jgi:hypothetical protein